MDASKVPLGASKDLWLTEETPSDSGDPRGDNGTHPHS